jgi:hypothetical protein
MKVVVGEESRFEVVGVIAGVELSCEVEKVVAAVIVSFVVVDVWFMVSSLRRHGTIDGDGEKLK